VPGISLHDDFDELGASGLTCFQVLSAATREPGAFIARTKGGDPFGMVAPGYRADLILSTSNPLAALSALRKPIGVMVRGDWRDAAALKTMTDNLVNRGSVTLLVAPHQRREHYAVAGGQRPDSRHHLTMASPRTPTHRISGVTMENPKSAARMIAALLLLQMACGPIVNFVLLAPVLGRGVFLENAAAHPLQIGVAVLVGLAMSAFSVGIAIVATPLFTRYSRAMALWLLAIAVAAFALAAVENVNVLSMLSLSQAYAKADPADAPLLRTLAVTVASPRNWAHYLGLIFAGSFAFVLYGVLFRFALVPRALAAFGLIGALLEIVAVALPLFGYAVIFPMLAPLGLAHLALMIWLITKGFAERRRHAR
jgi:hypothetical protein